jgi:hypothetical protein
MLVKDFRVLEDHTGCYQNRDGISLGSKRSISICQRHLQSSLGPQIFIPFALVWMSVTQKPMC